MHQYPPFLLCVFVWFFHSITTNSFTLSIGMNKSVCLFVVIIPFPFVIWRIHDYHWDTFVVGVAIYMLQGWMYVLSNDKQSKFLHTNLQLLFVQILIGLINAIPYLVVMNETFTGNGFDCIWINNWMNELHSTDGFWFDNFFPIEF